MTKEKIKYMICTVIVLLLIFACILLDQARGQHTIVYLLCIPIIVCAAAAVGYQQSNHQLEQIAFTSRYSGIMTQQKVEHFLRQDAAHGVGYTCVMIYIDNYSDIIRVFHDDAGTNFQMDVAAVLRNATQEGEFVCKIQEKPRFLMLWHTTDMEQVKERLAHLKQDLQVISVHTGNTKYICHGVFSAGVHIMNGQENDMEDLQAQIWTEKSLRDTNVSAVQQMTKEQYARCNQLIQDIPEALKEHQFSAYFQTIQDITSDQVIGAELSSRWQHPEFGVIHPHEFIPLLENNGYLAELDLYMIEEACKLIQTWVRNEVMPVPLHVNISRLDFYLSDFLTQVFECLNRYKIPNQLLVLELQTDTIMVNDSRLQKAIKDCHAVGVQILIDHFDSVQNGLEIIGLHPEMIKLNADRMPQSIEDTDGMEQLRIYLALAKDVGARVIMINLETEEQAALYHSAGCQFGQGMLFCTPLPKKEYEQAIF